MLYFFHSNMYIKFVLILKYVDFDSKVKFLMQEGIRKILILIILMIRV